MIEQGSEQPMKDIMTILNASHVPFRTSQDAILLGTTAI